MKEPEGTTEPVNIPLVCWASFDSPEELEMAASYFTSRERMKFSSIVMFLFVVLSTLFLVVKLPSSLTLPPFSKLFLLQKASPRFCIQNKYFFAMRHQTFDLSAQSFKSKDSST
uniref:Uncharacterized protein n=1 Tax=Glossina brevipalpis TaxID=37001 RepID=A0A1A9WHE7_9MUSC